MMHPFAKGIFLSAIALFAFLAHAAADVPRVMILGDELFAPAAAEIAKTLKGKAVVVHVKIPDVFALPKSIPFHPPILAALQPFLARN